MSRLILVVFLFSLSFGTQTIRDSLYVTKSIKTDSALHVGKKPVATNPKYAAVFDSAGNLLKTWPIDSIQKYSDSSGVSGTADTALHTPDSVRAAHKADILKHGLITNEIPCAGSDTTFVRSGLKLYSHGDLMYSCGEAGYPSLFYMYDSTSTIGTASTSDLWFSHKTRYAGESTTSRWGYRIGSTVLSANREVFELRSVMYDGDEVDIFSYDDSTCQFSFGGVAENRPSFAWRPIWFKNYRPSDSLAIDNAGSYKQGIIKSCATTDSFAVWKESELKLMSGSTLRTVIGAPSTVQLSDSLDVIRDTLAKHADTLAKYKDHANLNNLNSANYTHLTSTNHTDLTDAGASTLHYHTSDRDRANHTGTQAQSTIVGLTDTLANRLPLHGKADSAVISDTTKKFGNIAGHGKADSATVANGLNHSVTQYYLPYASTATAFNESIMSTAFSQIYVDGTLNARYGNLSLSIGADNGDKSTVTDNTNKTAKVFAPQYDTDDPGVCMFYLSNDATTNGLSHGGGTSSLNAVTSHSFYTAANNSTLTGTKRLGIASDGTINIGVCSDAGTDVDRFLVWDASGNIDHRTGSEVLSDIGAAASSHAHAISEVTSLQTELDGKLEYSKVAATVPAAGWYRVAKFTYTGGRGYIEVELNTTGGIYATRRLNLKAFSSWSTEVSLHAHADVGLNWWTDARITDDATYKYLEVNFVGAIRYFDIECKDYGWSGGSIYTGELPAGGDVVRVTKTLVIGDNFSGTANLGTCANAGSDVDKFLVSDATGNVDYRTGAEVLADIGALGEHSTADTSAKAGDANTLDGHHYSDVGVDIADKIEAYNNDTDFTVAESLFDGTTYRAVTTCHFSQVNHVRMLCFSNELTGTITTSTQTNIHLSHDVFDDVYYGFNKTFEIINNGTRQKGTISITGDRSFNISKDGGLTSYLDAGTGGLGKDMVTYITYIAP